MMNVRNLGSKESLGVKFKDGICTELCLKATGIFVKLLSQDGFENDCPEIEFQTITFQSQFEKVTVQKSIAETWIVISNQTIKNQLPHTQFD